MKILKKIPILLSLVILNSSFAYASNVTEKVVLNEKFDNNLNIWAISSGKNFKLDIINGKLILENKDIQGLLSTKVFETKIDQSKDFKIEAEIKKISGIENNSYDIVWGFKDKNNFYSFGVSSNGYYRYGKWHNGLYKPLINWTQSNFINKGNSKNKLAVRKYNNNEIEFFVNDKLVNKANFEAFTGNRQGIMLQSKMKVEADNFIIKQYEYKYTLKDLELNLNNDAPKIEILEPNVTRGFEVVSKDELIKIRGVAKDVDGISEVYVNGLKTILSDNGEFRLLLKLDRGQNTITVTAKDKRNKVSLNTFKIVYNDNPQETSPEIEIFEPIVTRGFEVVSKDELIKVRGIVKDSNGISELTVNGVNTYLKPSGEFETLIKLNKGENKINVIAKNNINRITNNTFIITYKKNTPHNPVKTVRKGNDYGILFATDKYDHWSNLVNPINDAKAIQSELKDNYGFSTELVENPTKVTLKSKLREYALKQYNPDDQLFIFIAGHGQFDNTYKEGYIVAKDSLLHDDIKDSYISHSELSTILNNINCKHIFLVMDVCFGGTFDQKIAQRGESVTDYQEITRTEFIERKLKNKTRLYLTSGGKEYVSDGRPGQHSPFARKFLEALRNYGGSDSVLTQSEINNYVEKLVPEPRYGEFGNNEPGSDFIFVVK